MSDPHTDCERFEDWLLQGAATVASRWGAHLEACSSCREQWAAHRMLVATFAEEAVPELSPAFQEGLRRRLDAAVAVRPLRGWRLAAMAGYALVAAALMRWVLLRFPLPSIAIDPASPWTLVVAFLAVPLTFLLTLGATRWLPAGGPAKARDLDLIAL